MKAFVILDTINYRVILTFPHNLLIIMAGKIYSILLGKKKKTPALNFKGSQYLQHANRCNTRACLFPGTSLYRLRQLEWAFIRGSLCQQFIMQMDIAPSCAGRFQPSPFTLHCHTTQKTHPTHYTVGIFNKHPLCICLTAAIFNRNTKSPSRLKDP